MRLFFRFFLSLICLLAPALAWAAAPSPADSLPIVRPVTSAFMLEAGSSHIADTYLTPLRYAGWHGALAYQRRQAPGFSPRKWVMDLRGELNIDRAQNPARNAAIWSLDLAASWSLDRRWGLAPGLTLAVGGYTGINAGMLYLARNGNNPVAAKGAWELGAHAFAAQRLSLFGRNVTFAYDVAMPLTGVFFTPDYGQLYYEIWLGERSGIVSGIWPGNYFRLDNRLTADIHFGATSLRLGYSCDIHSTKARGIGSRHITHAAIVGVVCEWLSLRPGSQLTPDARIISAAY